MSIPAIPCRDETAIPPFPIRRFSVAEYHDLIESGRLPSGAPFELLEGWITPKMSRGPRHDIALELLGEALRSLLPKVWRLRIQSAITTLDSEPEPDGAVVRGSLRDHPDRHPLPPEIAVVVEVADSSLNQDRNEKARLYARAGIPIYWIVNLVHSQVEMYTEPTGAKGKPPRYRGHQDYGVDERVPLVIAGKEIVLIAVRELLP